MSDYVSIGNQSLIKLGHFDPIISLTDGTKAAQLINARYEQVRDATLRMHPWNFAKYRVVLTALASPLPAWGDGSYFQLPRDCLRVLGTDDDSDNIPVEGRYIRFSATTLNILYIQQITDTSLFDAMFTECYTTRLAMEICPGLTQSTALFESLAKLYQQNLSDARTVNSFELGVQSFVQDDLMTYRN